MNIVVKIKFNEPENKWHMMLPDGTFVQEFYPCATFMKLFDFPNLQKESFYTLHINRLNND